MKVCAFWNIQVKVTRHIDIHRVKYKPREEKSELKQRRSVAIRSMLYLEYDSGDGLDPNEMAVAKGSGLLQKRRERPAHNTNGGKPYL